ncbi:MAG TPA: lytic transglycosylase domain-containing protein [bacterium]|nr:lytic transglycosylase domain-containing protein [bacterium]
MNSMKKIKFIATIFIIILSAGAILSIIVANDSFGINFNKRAIYKTIIFVSEKYKIPVPFLIAVMRTESNFNIHAISPKGAVGLMQVMPKTAEALNININNPLTNIIAGAKYLHYCLKKFGYKPVPALACYNAGPDSVKTVHIENRKEVVITPYRQTVSYIIRVYKYYDYYRKLLQ